MTILAEWSDSDGDEFVLKENGVPGKLVISVFNANGPSHVGEGGELIEPNEVYINRKQVKLLRKALKRYLEGRV